MEGGVRALRRERGLACARNGLCTVVRVDSGATFPAWKGRTSKLGRSGVVQYGGPEVDEEIWTGEDGESHAGWYCVSTDPFPCPAPGCAFVAEFMTAAHLVLVWQERDDPEPAASRRACEGSRPQPARRHVRAGLRPERVVLRVGGRRPAGARHSRQDVIERHFGESAPLSLGVEEEVMILDAETLEPAAAVDVLVRGAERLDLPGTFKTELHASVVELTTGICADVDEAIAALRRAACCCSADRGATTGS